MAAVPELGAIKYTPALYLRFAARLQEQARELGSPWTAASVEKALWARAVAAKLAAAPAAPVKKAAKASPAGKRAGSPAAKKR